jgi:hypothetical protein
MTRALASVGIDSSCRGNSHIVRVAVLAPQDAESNHLTQITIAPPPSTIVIFARHLPTEHLHAAHHEACREKTEAYTVKVMQQASRLAGAVVGAALVST